MGPYPYGNAYPSVGASLVAQSVKNLPTVQETWVRSPGWEDPLEKWQPTPVSLPRKSHGQKSLVGCSPWGCKGSGTTERLTLTYLPFSYGKFYYFLGNLLPSVFSDLFSKGPISKILDEFCNLLVLSFEFIIFSNFIPQFLLLSVLFTSSYI